MRGNKATNIVCSPEILSSKCLKNKLYTSVNSSLCSTVPGEDHSPSSTVSRNGLWCFLFIAVYQFNWNSGRKLSCLLLLYPKLEQQRSGEAAVQH